MAHLGNTIVNGALRVLGGENVDTINGVTVGSSPKFTDTNNAVTQTATTTDAKYEILFSATADNTTRTEGARKTTTLRFNPNKGALMEGNSTNASGSYSHAEGNSTVASNSGAHAEGIATTASGSYSHAEGSYTSASGNYSHTEGWQTTASGGNSHAEGHSTCATGANSHAEGEYAYALAAYAHAEGWKTCANKDGAHVEGSFTTASGIYAHAEGQNTYASGGASHAEGLYTSAAGAYSHAEGYGTSSRSTVSYGFSSHAEGGTTTAYGSSSHSEGAETCAGGDKSHAEGHGTRASGQYSHTEGYYTTASGAQSHAAGSYTCAAGADQTVVGKYNVADTTSLFIVGNGTANNARKNALSVASDGIVTLTGQLRTSFKSAVATGSYAPTANTIPNLCTELRYSSGVMGSVSINTAYTKDGVTIPTGWYNFMWIPHRSGGNSGAASGDNCDYGVLYLTAMTMESSFYLIRFSSGSITEVRNVLDADTGRYVCTDSVISYSPINKTVTRVGGTAGWNSHIYSKNGYKDSVYVSFKASQANKALMVGLNSDPTTDTNYTSLDYAWYLESNGTKTIYESGSKIASYGTYSANDEFRIEVHGGHIYYFYISSASQSGPQIQLIRVSGNSISKIFYLDSSFHDLSGSIYNLEFSNSIGIASKIQVEKEDGSSMGLTYLSVPFISTDTNDDLSTTPTLKYSNYFEYSPATHSIVCGEDSSASGYESFALGYKVQANANSSMAMGEGTRASGEGQLVIGKYNGVQGNGALFVIGNGSSDSARSNALVIGSDGRFYPTNTFPESYLGWNEVSAGDGRDLIADASPIDACLNDALRGNRFYGIPGNKITITYSRNGGSSWTDYGATEYDKTALFSEGSNYIIGKADGTNKATANGTNYQLRVLVDTLDVCYTVLRKIMINVSTNGSDACTVDFEVSSNNSSWTKIRTMGLAGWSGWNILNVGWIQTHNASRYLRFTFKANGGDTNYEGLRIFQIYGYGGFGWIVSSQMASSGTPYIPYGSKAAQFLGTLAVSSNNYNNYNEGIRINATANGAAVLTMGGSWGSLSGMNDYAWCFVTWTSTRRLVIGHGTSGSGSSTYFYKNDAGATPSLHIGENLEVDGTITGRMADYAEYFEWADGNPRSEERIAKFVTFDDGNKIRFATSNDDYILGVVSAHPFIIGNADGDDRDNEYLKDEYGRVIREPAPKMECTTGGKYIPVYDEHGKPVYEGTRPKPNPDYDPSKNVPRDKKPEWAPIGMLGILTVIDDGTCIINSYATVGVGGIATKAESNSLFKYRVIKRRTNNIIDIIFR